VERNGDEKRQKIGLRIKKRHKQFMKNREIQFCKIVVGNIIFAIELLSL